MFAVCLLTYISKTLLLLIIGHMRGIRDYTKKLKIKKVATASKTRFLIAGC